MAEKHRILDLAERSYRAQAWHGPSMLECLEGLPASLAAKPSFRCGRTIWELVEHVASWNEIVAERLRGKQPVVRDEWNFPPLPAKPTPAAWRAVQRRLARSQTKFARAVQDFPAAKLGRKRPGTDHTWSVLIHGQIQHQVWHAGQIAMTRRALGRPISSH